MIPDARRAALCEFGVNSVSDTEFDARYCSKTGRSAAAV